MQATEQVARLKNTHTHTHTYTLHMYTGDGRSSTPRASFKCAPATINSDRRARQKSTRVVGAKCARTRPRAQPDGTASVTRHGIGEGCRT